MKLKKEVGSSYEDRQSLVLTTAGHEVDDAVSQVPQADKNLFLMGTQTEARYFRQSCKCILHTNTMKIALQKLHLS
jgi:hypothetical protein